MKLQNNLGKGHMIGDSLFSVMLIKLAREQLTNCLLLLLLAPPPATQWSEYTAKRSHFKPTRVRWHDTDATTLRTLSQMLVSHYGGKGSRKMLPSTRKTFHDTFLGANSSRVSI